EKRVTKETEVNIDLNLDGNGRYNISTGIKFFDHMLSLFSKHSNIDLNIKASGDLKHHLVEDVAIVLGKAIMNALGTKRGIRRYGDKTIPMDETLCLCALDLSGRGYHHIDLKLKDGLIEDLEAENILHFFDTLAINSMMNLHIVTQYGENNHHIAEAAFKAFAHALREAVEIIGDDIPSTKELL
ncbi:MAG: imidazoleglycerol-phosphate dehydratase HisB, partial [Promethearchaeota archaeon]